MPIFRGTDAPRGMAIAAIVAACYMLIFCGPEMPRPATTRDIIATVIDVNRQHEMNGNVHYFVQIQFRDRGGVLNQEWEEVGAEQWVDFGRVGAVLCMTENGQLEACN